jgi:hypothetical protein
MTGSNQLRVWECRRMDKKNLREGGCHRCPIRLLKFIQSSFMLFLASQRYPRPTVKVLSEVDASVWLTTESDELCIHVDRKNALSTLLFTGDACGATASLLS